MVCKLAGGVAPSVALGWWCDTPSESPDGTTSMGITFIHAGREVAELLPPFTYGSCSSGKSLRHLCGSSDGVVFTSLPPLRRHLEFWSLSCFSGARRTRHHQLVAVRQCGNRCWGWVVALLTAALWLVAMMAVARGSISFVVNCSTCRWAWFQRCTVRTTMPRMPCDGHVGLC